MQHLDFLGQGLKFPFQFSEQTGTPMQSSDLDRINESIMQILETRPGERLMRPDFGSKVKDLVFEQNDAVLKGLLRFHIVDAVKRWEKRIMVTGIAFDEAPEKVDRHILLVRIEYRVIQGQVEGNLVLPFMRE